MRRGPLITAAAVVVLGVLLSAVTNWGTEIIPAPAWLKSPLVIGLVVAVLVLLLVVGGFLTQRQPEKPVATAAEPVFTTVAPSLRPPPPGPVFGRDDELAALTAGHGDPVLDVVCAGGGTGKTTLAREVARRHGAQTFWIDWRNDPDVLATSMVEVARTLGLAADRISQAQRSGGSLADLVWSHLESVRGWLVVVDNVDDVDPLQTGGHRIAAYRGWLRPTATGQMLVTTRIQDAELWGPHVRLHRIGRLSTAAGAAVLRNLAPDGGAAAEELAERLGGHSLALRAAGRAVGATTSAWPTFAAYLTALREQRISVLPDTPDATDPETARRLVGHTWEVSLDQLVAKHGTRLARPLLRALSLLAQAPIPRGLITPALLPEPTTDAGVDDALAGLDRYGLLEPSAAPGTVLLHPLVRETSAAFLAKEADVAPWRRRIEDRVGAFTLDTAARERDGWNDAIAIVPHALHITESVALAHDDDLAVKDGHLCTVLSAMKALANQLGTAGRHEPELEVWQRVLHTETEYFGPNHPDTVVAIGQVGWLQWQLGDLLRGEQGLRRAVLLAEPMGGAVLINARHNLALALMTLGAANEAVEHFTDVYAACLDVHGPDGSPSLLTRHHLAQAVYFTGQHARGVRMLRDVLAAKVRLLGEDHLETARCREDLAVVLDELGDHKEAVELQGQALEACTTQLGAEHPRALGICHSLARSHQYLGDHERALAFARRALAGRERVLGTDHQWTVASRALVAECEKALRGSTIRGRLRAHLHR